MKTFIKKATTSLALIALLVTPISAEEIASFSIDKAHSTIEFSVKHLGLSNTKGSFSDYDGTINWDSKGKSSSVEGTVKINSVDTRNEKRDTHLKSPDFFDAQKFPEMTFKSKSIKKSGKAYTLVADLTIKNVTKTISIPLTVSNVVKDPWGSERISLNSTFKINRQDYGLNFNAVLDNGGLVVANDIAITLDLEAIKNTKK